MFIIIALAALAVIGIVATLIDVGRDGYGPVKTDWTRVAEHDGLGTAAHAHSFR